jgi:hypothetical protein
VACRVSETMLTRRMRGVTLENELLSTTVLVDKGADIYRLVHRGTGIDVLMKTPWGLRDPGSGTAGSPDSEVTWMEHYEGGWQTLFPNGGRGCVYKGAELPFHGEASTLPWTCTVLSDTPDEVRVQFEVRLFRSPFRIVRVLSLRAGSPVLDVEETIMNEGLEPLDAMWSHHPAFGAPFLSPSCLVDTDARIVFADEGDNRTPDARVQHGGRWNWPYATRPDGTSVDLRIVPERSEVMAYLSDFAEGWCAKTNSTLGFGVALVWPATVFPYAWLWQEMHASRGYPWYGAAYTMALEPASSAPGVGLVEVLARGGSHVTFGPGESRTLTLRSLFYDAGSGHGVEHVGPDGTVRVRPADPLH